MAKDLLPFMRSDAEAFSMERCYARPWLCRKVSVWIGC